MSGDWPARALSGARESFKSGGPVELNKSVVGLLLFFAIWLVFYISPVHYGATVPIRC